LLWFIFSGPNDSLLSLIPNEIDLITVGGAAAPKLDSEDGVPEFYLDNLP
jgi:hypothetical protein